MKSKFITFEGIDGAGKSTHIEPLAKVLREAGHTVVVTREPGGIPMAEALRTMLLNESMDPLTETLLMFAARKEHLEQVIRPALERGSVVLCDRFTDSSFAYQGGGKGVELQYLLQLETMVQSSESGVLRPDLTLWFDIDPSVAAQRRAKARAADKFEAEDLAFFTRVAAQYEMREALSSGRVWRIDASETLQMVWEAVMTAVVSKGLMPVPESI